MPPSESSEMSTAMLKERRFKLSRACDRCRRRRIKCDEGHPCQACLSATSACTFEEPGKRTHPHKSKRTATLEDRMHHLEMLVQAIPPAVFASIDGSNLEANKSPTSPHPFPFPSGVPPPSLHVFPLINPSNHFTGETKMSSIQPLVDETSRMSLSASYLYIDDEGYTRWQGETSGLPLLDLLLERHSNSREEGSPQPDVSSPNIQPADWFPNRSARRTDVNPQVLWKLITTYIVPELMDSLVQCYLSTSYYILPFLHVPTFLSDYGNPEKWGEPGFATFIVAICCLASRHMDDPRVRADPADGISAGTQWFELLGRLRTLPISDRPTLYAIQADLIAAVYAVGLGRLSKAAALLSEAITVSIDVGLHRSSDTYDLFDPIETEVRKRTFWCVYIWDKQLGAHFGRPPMIRLRDCDVGEPAAVDDEFITREGMGVPPPGTECRMSAFICSLRLLVVLESVLDIPPPRQASSPFLLRAAAVMSREKGFLELREEEKMLDEIHASIPPFWSHTPETLATEDTIRLTQAERLHCAEQFVRLLIYRHRYTHLFAERTSEEQSEQEQAAMAAAHQAAVQIITTHLQVARKGLMTYYGVHVIHQLTQAGRTLVGVLLNCKSDVLQPLIPTGLDAVRSCVGLLRRFSGRYVCGLRSGDLMEEFCRLTQIPLEPIPRDSTQDNSRPAWIRPVRKKATSVSRPADATSQHSSPESFSEFLNESKPFVGFANGQQSSPSQISVSHSSLPGAQSPSFMDTSQMDLLRDDGHMDLLRQDPHMDLLRQDAHMYMSPSEVMALFDNAHHVEFQGFTRSELDVSSEFGTNSSSEFNANSVLNGN